MKYRGLGILIASFILTACGSGSIDDPSTAPDTSTPDTSTPDTSTPDTSTPDTSTPDTSIPPVQEAFIPEPKYIESVNFVDALNNPLTSANVVFTPVNQTSNFSMAMVDAPAEKDGSCIANTDENAFTNTTDDLGNVTLEGLKPGTYKVNICIASVNVEMQFTVLAENAVTAAVIAAPLTVDDEGDATKLPENSIILAVSGVIYSDAGVIANAQIAISGGASTNGAITTAITDEYGFYSIVINVDESKLAALQNATIQISADGFESLNIEGQDFTQFSAFSGVNIQLTAVTTEIIEFAYEENFEISFPESTCGEWTSQALMANEINLWHTHISGLNIVNQAYIANLVTLAPNDISEGKVPDPIEGANACWYGTTSSDGGIEEGNFLNEAGEEIVAAEVEGEDGNDSENELGGGELNGGTSTSAHAGALISPRIDLSSDVAPLALTFKTWWEIEAVNPNENGFDIMSVEYQIEGETEWITLIRLNPLADPAGNYSDSIPYSNTGFNRAPLWLEQAPISLDNLAGEVFKLRFTFSTNDPLFNGFRGWLLDDVKISYQVGTFPLWGDKDQIVIAEGEVPSFIETFNDETGETLFTTDLTVKSLDAVSAQLRFYSYGGEPLSEAFAVKSIVKGELQDISLAGDAAIPEGNFLLAVELVDASEHVKATYIFGGNGFSEEPM